MKISPISNNNNFYKTKNNQSFKGGVDTMLAFWDAIDRGGTAANFLLQDLLGSGLPRTAIALNRNRKETGKLNYIAGGETAIREFTTSPSMFLVPALAMYGLSVPFGKANNVPLGQIIDFSDIAKKTVEELGEEKIKSEPEIFKNTFMKNVMESIKKNNFEGANLESQDKFFKEITSDLEKVSSGKLKKRSFIQKMKNKGDGTSLDETISRIDGNFAKIKQHTINNYSDEFSSAVLGENSKSMKFSKIFGNAEEYFKDFSKKITKKKDDIKIEDFVEQFKHKRIAGRFLTGIIVTALTAITMVSIPKLYQLSKTNPEASAKSKEGK